MRIARTRSLGHGAARTAHGYYVYTNPGICVCCIMDAVNDYDDDDDYCRECFLFCQLGETVRS